ncbi:MAG: hypothetical protein E7179_00100 [Erysipelotrichaceae bacterium]|jgi:hypothetical protein|nr:hypothetical protein [Erysipelotrichaceae bacterium]
MTMKKTAKLKFLSLATLVFAGVFGGAAGTVAWFTTNVHIEEANMLLTGDALGAYFEYGDGTDEKPYGIKTVRQLYNLSWLQYLGYFNPTKQEGYPYSGRWTEAMKKVYGNDFNQKPHFELAGDIDFSNKDASSIGINGMPPIGTTAFPFEGFFDGRGYTISHGVFATSSSDFGIKPLAVTTYNADTNVGVFGKVSGAETSIKDLGISSPLVKSTLADTVIGAAIGDAGNASISNIAVDDPTLNIGNGTTTASAPISDYGLVGKTDSTLRVKQTDHAVYKLDVAQETFTGQASASTTQWGGSIDMQSLHTRLADIMVNYAVKDTTLPRATTEYYDLNGDEITAKRNTSSYLQYYASGTGYGQIRKYNADGVAQGKTYDRKIGTYQIGTWNNNYSSNGAPNTWLLSLSGGHWAEKHYQSPSTVQAFTISDGGTNYLCVSGTTPTNSVSPANPTEWFAFGSDNYSACFLATLIDNNIYYLKSNGTTLELTTDTPTSSDAACVWNVSVSESSETYTVTSIQQGGEYLRLSQNKIWGIQPDSCVLYGNNKYLATPENYYVVRMQTSIADATEYQIDQNSRIYNVVDSTTVYMVYYSSSYPCAGIDDDLSSAYVVEEYDGKTYLKRTDASSWLVVGSSSFSTANSRNSATQFQIIRKQLASGSQMTQKNIGWYDSSKTTAGMSYDNQDVSYVPLNVASADGTDEGDSQSIKKYQAKFNNTGYILGGSNFTSATSSHAATYGQGTTRVASYDQSNHISDCLSTTSATQNKTITHVYTVSKNQQDGTFSATEIVADSAYEKSLQKYAKAKEKLTSVLAPTTKVYGLHFTQADIQKKNLVRANYARINGEEYPKSPNTYYQMPANSIDFTLKQKGYVNFFAGSYVSSNNVDSFFSLHRIKRSDDSAKNITDIEEIEQIYGSEHDNYSYAYKVVDTTNTQSVTYRFTKPYRINALGERFELEKNPQGQDVPYVEEYLTEEDFASNYPQYSLKFDVSVIKKNTAISSNRNKLFYFEIPTNEGEFCLGSVSDGVSGGYLLYLDIGANAQKNNRTEVHERFVDTTSELVFPKGVVLVQSSTTTMAALYRNAGTDAYGNPGREKYGSDLSELDSISLRIKAGEAGTIEIERQAKKVVLSRDGPPVDLRYAPLNLPVQDGESVLSIVKESETEVVTNRLTYYDVDPANGSWTTTKIVFKTGDTQNTVTQVKDNEAQATPSVMKGNAYGNNAGTTFTAKELQELDISYSPSSTVLEYSFQTATDNTVTLTAYDLIPILNDETGFYSFGGYTYTMTKSGTAFQVYVSKLENGTGAIVVTIEGNPVSYTFTYTINGNTLAVGPNTVFA